VEKVVVDLSKTEEKICKSLGASSNDRFIFATSGKEAMQKVFLAAYLDMVRETGRTHFLTYSATTPTSLHQRMEKLGCLVKTLSVNAQGQVTRAALEEELRARTALVSLPWADPFTGVIHPILDLAQLCREREILLHVDGSDVLGKFFFRFQDFSIDFLTFEGTSLDAPLGTGGLLVRREKFSSSLQLDAEGASSLALLELETSLEKTLKQIEHLGTETARLRNTFEERLLAELPDVSILFAESERVPHISAIAFEGVHQEALRFFLERRGVFIVSGGERDDCLSFSFSHTTTEEEIDRALEAVIASVKKLRSFSVIA